MDQRDHIAGEHGSSTCAGQNSLQKTLPCQQGLEHSYHPHVEPYTSTVISDPALSGSWKPFILCLDCPIFGISHQWNHSVFCDSLCLSHVSHEEE